MSVPKLRFKEFSGDWEEKTFQDVSKINQGLQIPISDRFLEIGENRHFYITNEFLREDSKKQYFIENPPNSVLCVESDVLMTRTGNTGKVVTNIKGAFHNNFFKITYDKQILNKGFLCEFLCLNKTQSLILKLAGTSTIPDLNHSDFYKIKIQFPSLPEQTKIANFLTAVDEKISLLTKKADLLSQYKKGVMQQIFKQELRFKDDDGQEFPEWEEKNISEVLKIGSGKDYKKLASGDIPVYGTGGYMLSVNDFLYDGESVCIGRKGTIDRPVLLTGKFWTVDTLFYTHSFIKSLPRFIYAVFQNINWKNYNEASGVPSLSKSTIEKIGINIPSLPEQTKIANFLSAIDEKITNNQTQLNAVKQYKQGLLQQMFV